MKNKSLKDWGSLVDIKRGVYGVAIKINSSYRSVDLYDLMNRYKMGGACKIHKLKHEIS